MSASGQASVRQRNANPVADVAQPGLLDLRVRRAPCVIDISREALERIQHHGVALSKCAEAAGVQDKTVIVDLSYDPASKIDGATWSRIKAGVASASWETQTALMDAMGNELPFFWQVHSRGYDPRSLRRYETDVERDNRALRERVAQLEQERDVITRFVRDARGGL